jgi:hypothetical protein
VRLTCTQFVAGKCAEPGKAFDPDRGIKQHDQLQKVRDAMKAALNLGAGEIGRCLLRQGVDGAATIEQGTQAACIASARVILNQVELLVLQHEGATQ